MPLKQGGWGHFGQNRESKCTSQNRGSDLMVKQLALPTLDHRVSGSNPGGKILSEPEQRFIAHSPSCSPFHCPDTTEILLKEM